MPSPHPFAVPLLCTVVTLPLAAQRFVEAERSALPRECIAMHSIFVADLDSDGVPDLVPSDTRLTASPERPLVLRGDGFGSWTTIRRNYSAIALGVADMDGDGDRDIVHVYGIERNLGGGAFATVPWNGGGPIMGPAVVGDFTGDGLPDVLFLSPARFLRNLGGLAFVDETLQRVPAGVYALSGCGLDADGDGDLDVYAGDANGHMLLLNQAGVLAPAPTASMPAFSHWPRACVASDVDGDGDQDIVHGGTTARLLRNVGGTFVDAGNLLPTVAVVLAVAVGDVDGDGDRDLLFGQDIGGLLLRQQNGAFVTAPGAFDAHGHCLTALALADLDGDGDLDVVQGKQDQYAPSLPFLTFANSGVEPSVAWNDGTGSFHDALRNDLPQYDGSGFGAVGDLDGDGDPDVVLADGSGTTLRNRGNGTFDAVALALPASGRVALGDLNGDTLPDLVLLASDGRFWSFTNVGGGLFTPRSGPHLVPVGTAMATAIGLVDLNGDGALDVFVATGIAGFWPLPSNTLDAVWLGQGGSFVHAPAFCTQATSLEDAVLGDVDGDGDLDAIGPGLLLRNLGGTFGYEVIPRMSGVGTVALDDVDGDGDLDLVTGTRCVLCGGSYHNPVNYLNLNDGSGGFAAMGVFPGSDYHGTWAVAIADLDSDGDLDVLFGNDTSEHAEDQMYIRLGNGQWNLVPNEFALEGENTRQLLVADFDGDGDADVLALNLARDVTGSPRTKLFVNRSRQLVAPYAPRIGRPYALQAHGATAGAAVWLALQPAHLPLPPFGTLGLDPATASPFALLPAPATGSVAELAFVLPNTPTLAGLFVAVQGFDLAALALGNTLHETFVAW
jgi:hypothetical protein